MTAPSAGPVPPEPPEPDAVAVDRDGREWVKDTFLPLERTDDDERDDRDDRDDG